MTGESDPLPHFKQRLLQAGTFVSSIGMNVAAAALIVVVALNFANVVMRYFFFSALSWAEEVMLYFMILGVFLGAIAVSWSEAHIRIDALMDALPTRWRRLLYIVNTVVAAAILVPVTIASAHVVYILFVLDERSDAVNAPMWIPQGVVPLSLLLIIVLSLVRLVVPIPPRKDRHKPVL